MTRSITYATDNGPNDGTDIGIIESRRSSFEKLRSDSDIRISYTDNFRALGNRKACRWEILIDGTSCPSQPLVYDNYLAYGNAHRSETLVGYCSGLDMGLHEIQIYVDNTPGYYGSDCFTGWKNSTWVIEAEEVNCPEILKIIKIETCFRQGHLLGSAFFFLKLMITADMSDSVK